MKPCSAGGQCKHARLCRDSIGWHRKHVNKSDHIVVAPPDAVSTPTGPSSTEVDNNDTLNDVTARLPTPSVKPSDYETDTYLKNLYLYLTLGELPNNDKEARIVLLLQENIFVNSAGLVYKQVQCTEISLVLPQIYLPEVVARCHELGHFSSERNYQLLRSRFYAKNLHDAVVRYSNTCDLCQRMKRDCKQIAAKLTSLQLSGKQITSQ